MTCYRNEVKRRRATSDDGVLREFALGTSAFETLQHSVRAVCTFKSSSLLSCSSRLRGTPFQAALLRNPTLFALRLLSPSALLDHASHPDPYRIQSRRLSCSQWSCLFPPQRPRPSPRSSPGFRQHHSSSARTAYRQVPPEGQWRNRMGVSSFAYRDTCE